MKQNEAAADSAARGFNLEPQDDALHSELARANLLRLRGDFAAAESICLAVLERHPQSPAAHTLLGDIAFTQDRIPEAIQHYEVALSLDPHAPDIPRKLQEARLLTQVRETASAEEQLGLPPARAIPWMPIAFGALAAICLIGAAVAGLKSSGTAADHRAQVLAPTISATADTLVTPPPVAEAAEPKIKSPAATVPESRPEPTNLSAEMPLEDRTLFQLLQGRSQEGSRLVEVSQDPRTKMIALTYSVGAEDDARAVGAELARTTLEQSLETLIVTLRAVREGRLVYVADVPRTRYADTLSEDWQRNNPDAAAWPAYVVTNEWPYRSSDSASTGGKTP